MELTLPRSPTISVAIEAYVVSEVTTLTGAAGGTRRGEPGLTAARTKVMIDSMSVRLVFMGAHGPDRLEGELVVRARIRDALPLVLEAQEHPFALPHRERRSQLSRDDTEIGRLDIVVAGAENEPLVQSVRRADVSAEPCGPCAGDRFLECEQLTSQRPLVIECPRWWPPGQSELEPADLRPQRRIRIRPVQRRASDLHVRRPGQLPEVEQVCEVRRPAGVAEQLGVAAAARDLHHELVCTEAPKRPVQRNPGSGEPVFAEERGERQRIFGLGQRVQMPAVELAELLAELADVEPQPSRQTRPVGIAFLETHLAAFETDEHLRP